MVTLVIFSIIFYFLGSFPTSYLIGKKKYKIDILEIGSNHSGLSNIYKISTKKTILIILFIDVVIKGFLPTIFVVNFFYDIAPVCIFLIIGHNWSLFLKFKGGKGLTVSIGLLSGINFLLFICLLSIFLFFWVIFRFKDSSLPWMFSFVLTSLIVTFDNLFYHFFSHSIFMVSNYLIIPVTILLLFRRILGNGEYNIYNWKIIFNRLLFDRDKI